MVQLPWILTNTYHVSTSMVSYRTVLTVLKILWVPPIHLFLYPAAAAAAKSHQSCPTLCDPIDGSPQGSPVPGILQARTLEWVAISFSFRYHKPGQSLIFFFFSFYCLPNFASSKMSCGWKHTYGVLSPRCVHPRFFNVFSCLENSFFLTIELYPIA